MWIQSTNRSALGAPEAPSLRNSQASVGRGVIHESEMTTAAKSRGPPKGQGRRGQNHLRSDAQGGDRAKGVDTTHPAAAATAGRFLGFLRVIGPLTSSPSKWLLFYCFLCGEPYFKETDSLFHEWWNSVNIIQCGTLYLYLYSKSRVYST